MLEFLSSLLSNLDQDMFICTYVTYLHHSMFQVLFEKLNYNIIPFNTYIIAKSSPILKDFIPIKLEIKIYGIKPFAAYFIQVTYWNLYLSLRCTRRYLQYNMMSIPFIIVIKGTHKIFRYSILYENN